MKRYLTLFAFTTCLICHAQVPDDLTIAVKEIGIKDADFSARPDFTFYSKNYEKVFDYYQYTFDAQKLSKRSVYVSPDNKFYFGNNGGFIMDMQQQGINVNRINCSYAYDIGGLYRGLKNIFEMEKDYSVKRKADDN